MANVGACVPAGRHHRHHGGGYCSNGSASTLVATYCHCHLLLEWQHVPWALLELLGERGNLVG